MGCLSWDLLDDREFVHELLPPCFLQQCVCESPMWTSLDTLRSQFSWIRVSDCHLICQPVLNWVMLHLSQIIHFVSK